MTTGRPRIGLTIIVKNEGRYLVEWLAHHRLMGFDHFYIVDNESTDNTRPLLQALSRELPLTLFSFPTVPGLGPQLPAYEEVVRRHGHEVDWMAFLDADEFLWPAQYPDTVSDLIGAALADNPDVGAIALNWATYGSSMKLAEESQLVTARFLRHAHQNHHLNHHFKSIIRMASFAGFVCPHSCALKPGYRYLHTDGSEKSGYTFDGQLNPSQSGEVCWTRFRINHYVIKSYAEFVHRKSARGRGFSPKSALDDRFFVGHDNNDELSLPDPQHALALSAQCQALNERLGLTDPNRALAQLAHPALFDAGNLRLPVAGSVDWVQEEAGCILVTGWALLWNLLPAVGFIVTFQGRAIPIETWQATERPDVRRCYPGAQPGAGFDIRIRKPLAWAVHHLAICAITPEGHITQSIALAAPPGTEVR